MDDFLVSLCRMKARVEEVYRAFLGRPNDRALLSAFSLHPETIGDIYQNYGACFASLAECCQFINYVADYPKSDDLFASKWGVSRRSFKPKLNQSIEWMHSHINEVLLFFFWSVDCSRFCGMIG